MGRSPKWSHAECLFRDKWLLLPNKLEERAALEKFTACPRADPPLESRHFSITARLLSNPAFQESPSPSALGSGAQQSLPFQTRRVPANLPGISSGGSWQEVNREKETCPEYDCFEFGLSMPLGLGYNKKEYGKNGIFPVLLLHLVGFRI